VTRFIGIEKFVDMDVQLLNLEGMIKLWFQTQLNSLVMCVRDDTFTVWVIHVGMEKEGLPRRNKREEGETNTTRSKRGQTNDMKHTRARKT
jgi:hypothetical protein